MSIEAVLNQKDTFQLMFHTAINEVSITEETAKNIFDVKQTNSETAQSWGGEQEARYVKNNTLSIENYSWDSLIIWIDKHSGPGTQGKFGPNLFDNQLIEINYNEQNLIVHSLADLDQFSDYKELKISLNRGIMFIDAEMTIGSAVYKNKFMVHSGYGSTLLIDDQFSEENELGTKLEMISESELRDSYGNVLKTKKAILPGLNIGGFQFDHIPINFFEGAIGNQKFSVMGCEILKRFNIVLDLAHEHIYLKPSKYFKNEN